MSNKEPVFKQTNWATGKAHIFASFICLQSEEAIRTGYRAVEIKPTRINQIPQAKSISPFLASTTKLRGGRFPLIGQGKLCVSGDFPHSNG
jgi:hypothetical protein